MKRYIAIRIFSILCLTAYILWLFYLLTGDVSKLSSTVQFKGLRALGFLGDERYEDYINEYVDLFISFIPIGFLTPFARGRKGLGGALCFGLLLLGLYECLRFYSLGGIIAIDDELWSMAGIIVGYGFYTPVVLIMNFDEDSPYMRGGTGFLWLVPAILFAFIVYKETDIQESAAREEIREDKSEAATELMTAIDEDMDGEIYERLREGIGEYKEKIVFEEDQLVAQTIFDEFVNIMEEHPEFFYLTGGARIDTVTYGNDKTLTFVPEYSDPVSELPEMTRSLEEIIDSFLSECPGGSEYNRALWVHDRLVNETRYDTDVHYVVQSIEETHFDHAYTSYGALVMHRAVCAGYARAFQLILERMGIECGYVSGTAVNSVGDNEQHAWNYVKLDGEYYLCDVTWDDPVSADNSDINRLSHEYFCLSTEDMGRDHFPDEDQSVPDCPKTRSPY